MAVSWMILAMGPAGDMRRFVEESGAGEAIDGDDVEGAADVLRRAYEAKTNGVELCRPDPGAIGRFERRELSGALAEALDRVVASARQMSHNAQGQEPLPMRSGERAGEAA